MNIDFIKWKAEKAGFKIEKDSDGDEYVYFTDTRWCCAECIDGYEILNGYLLQRAIEGVNRGDSKYFIEQFPNYLAVGMNECETAKVFPEWDFGKEDNAKEAALMYIYEQEKLL